jgi:serine/threonine-protein kinase
MEADSAATFATAAGLIVGTLHYLSPEQAVRANVDGRSDLFSLGCTMYYLLSGRLPFFGATLEECLSLRIKGSPAPIADLRADLSPHVGPVLDKLLARRPEDRFQTAAEAAHALRNLANEQTSVPGAVRPTQQAVPEPSVLKRADSQDPSLAVDPSVPYPREPLVRAQSTWSQFVNFIAAHPPLITLLIVLFELAVFALGFVAAFLVR